MSNKDLTPKGIRLYYALDSGAIESGIAIRVESNGSVVRFDDGGWNPANSCFVTEAQCRRHGKIPTPSFVKANKKLAAQLERLAESARRMPTE